MNAGRLALWLAAGLVLYFAVVFTATMAYLWHAVRQDKRQRHDAPASVPPMSAMPPTLWDALIITCKPCNGEPGLCQCPRKCPYELCSAADTRPVMYSADDVNWLRCLDINPGETP